MNSSKMIIFLFLLALVGFFIYHVFIETLSFSELAGKSNNPMAAVFLNSLDFDTGLTRWDAYNLQKKAVVWQKRQKEILSIPDVQRRNNEHEKLMAEMMQDPGFKKLSKKVFGMGAKGIQGVLAALTGFALF